MGNAQLHAGRSLLFHISKPNNNTCTFSNLRLYTNRMRQFIKHLLTKIKSNTCRIFIRASVISRISLFKYKWYIFFTYSHSFIRYGKIYDIIFSGTGYLYLSFFRIFFVCNKRLFPVLDKKTDSYCSNCNKSLVTYIKYVYCPAFWRDDEQYNI